MQSEDAVNLAESARTHAWGPVDGRPQLAAQRPPYLLRRVLMALELRWTVEDRVLIRSLNGTQGVMPGAPDDAERELEALRRLASLARDKDLGIEFESMLVRVIETLAALRSQRISQAMVRAQRAGMVDTQALVREADRVLEEWRSEFPASGDLNVEVRGALSCLSGHTVHGV